MMVAFDPVKFIARHGVVLASGKGPVPSLAEAVAGEPIRGSWWSHPQGQEISRALGAADDSPDVLRFRLVGGKITLVHRRLWPALVRLADELGKDALAVLRQEHTPSGAHRSVATPFPDWVPNAVAASARKLSAEEARAQLGAWVGVRASTPRRAARARR
jgi:hypothetical protein